jgi:hypothetical protein
MRHIKPALLLLVGVALAHMGQAATLASDAGRTLYRDGIGADRRPVAAVVQDDVDSSTAALACANCHKRSGLGTSEGRNRVPPLTATALFGSSPGGGTVLPARLTPVYDDETVRRAIMLGIGADGRELAPFMPRYHLADADAAALIAYLHTLGTLNATEGASATDVNLVTIVADSAPAAEREAVVGVLSRFVAIKNSGTRRESARAAASRRQLYGERHVRGYRHWNFQVWTLTGGPETWGVQLEQRYTAAPPFAVLSGAVGDDWATLHSFCERHELPCIMPVTSVPGDAAQNHYNVYYSEGALTQARVTARDLLGDAHGSRDRLLLLHRDDTRGRAARDAFESAWRAGGGTGIRVHMTPAGTAPSIQEWRDVLKKHRPEILIAWLDPAQLSALAAAANGMEDGPRQIYTAEDFTSWQGLELPNPFGERVRHVYPYRLPAPGRAQFPREDVWLHTQKLDALARVPAAKALFACHATGEALAEMAGNYSRDYLIETLEHMLDGTNMTTLYPLTTLGTGQRFLAKGAYVARPGHGDTSGLFTEGHWVQL